MTKTLVFRLRTERKHGHQFPRLSLEDVYLVPNELHSSEEYARSHHLDLPGLAALDGAHRARGRLDQGGGLVHAGGGRTGHARLRERTDGRSVVPRRRDDLQHLPGGGRARLTRPP